MKLKLLILNFFCFLVKQIECAQQCDCGHAGDNLSTKIQPWLVLIKSTGKTSLGSAYCAGTLIDSQHVITAAFCLRELGIHKVRFFKASEIEVFFNTTKRNDALVSISDVVRVENYYHEARYAHMIKVGHDFAILKLKEPVTNAKPICIPQVDDAKYFKLSTFGWGSVSPLGKHSDLIERQVKRLSPEACESQRKAAESWIHFLHVWEAYESTPGPHQICAFSPYTEACNEDVGSPLVYKDPRSGRFWLVGFTEYSPFRCKFAIPRFYTSVFFYYDYLKHFVPNICSRPSL